MSGWRDGYADVAAAIAALAGNAAIGRVDSVNTTATKLTGLASASFGEGALVWVTSVGALFELQHTSLTTDNITCVNASGKAGYQWVRQVMPNRAFWSAATFPTQIDPAAGSDENTGLAGSPLKTFAEWNRRTMRAQLSASITVNLLSDAADADDIICDCDPFDVSAATVTLQGVNTVASTNLVTAVQARDPATNKANQITTVADLSAFVGSLLRVQGTSNYAVITKAVAAGTLRLGELFNTTTLAQASAVGVTAGQTIEIMTLAKGPLRVWNMGRSPFAAQDVRFDGAAGVSWRDTRNTTTYIIRRCVFGGTGLTFNTQNGGGGMTSCSFKSLVAFSGGASSGTNLLGSALIGSGGTGINSFNNAGKTVLNGCVSQVGGVQFGTGGFRITGDFGSFDMPAGKIGLEFPFDNMGACGRFTTGRHYGSGNNATSNVWALNVMNQITYQAASPPTCDAGNGVLIVATNTPIGSLPVAFSNTTGAGVYAI